MPDFDDLSKLFAHLDNQIKDVMENEMAEMAKDEEQKSIKRMVYDVYDPSPSTPPRRGTSGGLMDKRNMIATVHNTVDGIELFINNITDGNPAASPVQDYTNAPNYLTNIIVKGRPTKAGYYINRDERKADVYTRPRDFLSDAINNIQTQLLHIETMKRGLKRRNIDTD